MVVFGKCIIRNYCVIIYLYHLLDIKQEWNNAIILTALHSPNAANVVMFYYECMLP